LPFVVSIWRIGLFRFPSFIVRLIFCIRCVCWIAWENNRLVYPVIMAFGGLRECRDSNHSMLRCRLTGLNLRLRSSPAD